MDLEEPPLSLNCTQWDAEVHREAVPSTSNLHDESPHASTHLFTGRSLELRHVRTCRTGRRTTVRVVFQGCVCVEVAEIPLMDDHHFNAKDLTAQQNSLQYAHMF